MDADQHPVDETLGKAAEPGSPGVEIPQFHQLFREILTALSHGEAMSYADVSSSVADQIGLDERARQARLASGKSVFENRVQWGLTSLIKAELVELVGPGSMRITDAGRGVLQTAVGPIDRNLLIRTCPSYAAWFADMGLTGDEARENLEPTVWMLRAGRKGIFAPDFVERLMVVVGWGETGDVTGLSREEISERVKTSFPGATNRERGQATNTLQRLAEGMVDGDLASKRRAPRVGGAIE